MVKRNILIILICGMLLFNGMAASADRLPDLTELMKLIGEYGALSFHLENLSLSNIDFDFLLRIIGYNDYIDYSKLNYDALLEVILAPETLAELGIETIDEDALLDWLKDPDTGETLNGMMLSVKNGGSLSECVQALSEDPDLLRSFSLITNGKDLHTVRKNLNSEKAADILNKAAAALITPRSGPPSEAALALSSLVQKASDTLGWK